MPIVPIYFFLMPVFPISRSKVHILRRFLKILHRCAYAGLQLLQALTHRGWWSFCKIYKFPALKVWDLLGLKIWKNRLVMN